MTYTEAKAHKDQLESATMQAGAKLNSYPKGQMGLVGNDVRNSAAFKADKAAYDQAAAKSDAFAKAFLKTFKKQYLAERQAKMMGRK